MPEISLKGIRIDAMSLTRTEDGNHNVTGNYSLISSADKVLAKQSIGGYGSLELKPSPTTIKAMNVFIDAYRSDVLMLLGLDVT